MTDQTPSPLWQRLAWFVGLWLLGLGTVSVIGYGIKLWLK